MSILSKIYCQIFIYNNKKDCMESNEEYWDVDDVLENNTSVFIVKNLPEDCLLYALSVVYQYIQLYNLEDEAQYDILYYAEPKEEPKSQFFIFTTLPYDRFLDYNREFQIDE
jgi:hypothetical protein